MLYSIPHMCHEKITSIKMPKYADDTKLFITVNAETIYEKLKKSPKRSNGFSQ